MNTKIFRQYDGPWARKPYPTKGCTVSGAGCGLVACTHMAIEQERYKNWTPETLRPYMLQYAIAGQGTTWHGIRKTLEHLGYKVTHISESTPMKDAFAELNKGNRIGIILFYGGYSKRYKKWYRTPDGTVWTGNGHYIMFANYKYENGNHWFYMKDSGGRKHDGWYSYEKSMKGCVGQMWIAERVGTQTTSHKATTVDGKLVVDGNGGVATIKAMQRFFGVTQDGVISSQNKNLKRFYPAFKSVSYSDKPKGSLTVEKLQRWLGISPDGILGKQSVMALQKKLGVKADGIFGPASMKAWQKYLNEHDKAVYPTVKITKGDKIASSAKSYVGKVKYVLGGKSLKTGIDCTGFIQAIYGLHGIKLDNKLSSWGKSIGTDISKAKPGDIVTYKKNGKISHHAIYIGNRQVVHAANPKSGVIKSGVNISGMSIEGIRRRWSPGK